MTWPATNTLATLDRHIDEHNALIIATAHFGAVGDGVADDTAAITSALAALPATGGVVYLPAGEYKVTSTITLGARQILRGAGGNDHSGGLNTDKGPTTITSSFNGSVIRANASGFAIENLMVYGDAAQAAQVLVDIGDNATARARFALRDIHLKNAGQDALKLRGLVLQGHFDRVYCHGAERHGLYATGATNNVNVFNGCLFRECKRYGAVLEGGEFLFNGASFESNSRDATTAYGGMLTGGGASSILSVTLNECHFENNMGLAPGAPGVPIKQTTALNKVNHIKDVGSFYADTKPAQLDVGYFDADGISASSTPFATIAAGHWGSTWKNCVRDGALSDEFSLTDSSQKAVLLGNALNSHTVASAATVTLPQMGSAFHITGTTSITSVTASWIGRTVTLIFDGALTFTDGVNLRLAGNLVTTADDTITLACDGTNWYEVGRSVN